ncbi:hypothetical protein EG240_14225 [Paenimyroides tangerinum]|uniref:Uncharacterized protein n=1 Tax=Paenimyroides tangerinum TaxID=2488728 RepID=A0A3P3VYX9_9FLAO|nr:hypothetical protein [Paenimyroides tangerinum]RRJ88031.1 hypothetical protein EG240_14225 [Paenimyroides tangerinum]
MKKVFLLAIAVAFTFASCNKDTKAEATTDATATETNAAHEDHTGHDHGTEAPVANEATPGQPAPNQATNTPAATNAQGVKLNPPHGQPGHRCEIAVGAPLDGSAAPAQTAPTPAQPQAQPASGKGFLGSGNAQTQAAPTQQAAPTAQKAAPQQTDPGMQGKPNPAHGQPGHRCDIQVGQPLP